MGERCKKCVIVARSKAARVDATIYVSKISNTWKAECSKLSLRQETKKESPESPDKAYLEKYIHCSTANGS